MASALTNARSYEESSAHRAVDRAYPHRRLPAAPVGALKSTCWTHVGRPLAAVRLDNGRLRGRVFREWLTSKTVYGYLVRKESVSQDWVNIEIHYVS